MSRADSKQEASKTGTRPQPSNPPEDAAPGEEDLFVVGIGASAGGLEALRAFVSHLPKDANLSYVVAQHLAPQHSSMLVQLLAREAELRVVEIADGMAIEANTIYITPPNADVGVSSGVLTLRRPGSELGPKPSVDSFLTALAEDRGDRAIGIILSGTGSDGAHGIRAIKAAGGIAIAQDQASAKYASMPNAAVATGCVDLVLPPDRIGPELLTLASFPRLPVASADQDAADTVIRQILEIINETTGLDFRQYKPGTITRRIETHVAAHKIGALDQYISFLRENPAEVGKLSKSILISVTAFFRDKPAFDGLRKVIDRIVEKTPPGNTIRIWVPGCATGEEPYTIAILLAERLGEKLGDYRVNIFGTDIDEEATNLARRGAFGEAALKEVPPAILKRYFRQIGGAWQVIKMIRDMVVFARHDVTKDPPFLNLDLISCRNLLIYFGQGLQAKIFGIFHYALKPNGFLFLGRSESVTQGQDLFADFDRKHRIFIRHTSLKSRRTSSFASPLPQPLRLEPVRHQEPSPPLSAIMERELAAHFAPISALVDGDFTLMHSHGAIDRYIKLPAGKVDLDITGLVPRGVRALLRSLLYRAQREGVAITGIDKVTKEDGAEAMLRLTVHPVETVDSDRLYLVCFEETSEQPREGKTEEEVGWLEGDALKLAELEHALKTSREHLQTVIEELETSNEELETSNEELQSLNEMQAANEELQASNEELETSNEELQSTNEELITVNEELEQKSAELSAANTDLENIQNSIGSPLVVIDRHRRIRRFNLHAGSLFKLTLDSIGRSILSIDTQIDPDHLSEDIAAAIDRGQSAEHVLATAGHYYLRRIQPCYDDAGAITGAVLVFFDSNELVVTQKVLEESEARLRRLAATQAATLNGLPANIALLDHTGAVVTVNQGWARFARDNGYSDDAMGVGANYINICEGACGRDTVLADAAAEGIRQVLHADLPHFMLDYPSHTASEQRWYRLLASPVPADGVNAGAVVMLIEVTDRVLSEQRLRQTQKEAEAASAAKSAFLAHLSHELRTPLNAIIGFAELLQKEMYGTLGHPRYHEYVDDIHRSGSHLLQIILSILDLTKVEAGKIEVRDNVFDPGVVCREAVRMVEVTLAARGVAITVALPQALPRLRADMQLVRQILLNLLTNAVKFTPGGGKVTIGGQRYEDGGLALTVTDTGVGMTAAEVEAAMEPFVQVRNSLTSKVEMEGIGLGLPLVKSMIELHDGSIAITSEPGRGTTVTLLFPPERILEYDQAAQ